MNKLDSPIQKLNKVGATIAGRLEKIGLKTINDLIYHYPFRYDSFDGGVKIDDLQVGQMVNIIGTIELIDSKRSYKKRMSITEALVNNESGQIKIIWFNQPYIAKTLKMGDLVSLTGKIDSDFTGMVMKSPNYEKILKTTFFASAGIEPVYHLTANITQKQLRFLLKQVKNNISTIPDWLPENIVQENNLLSLSTAINKIHFPKNQSDIDTARRRISFNELFLTQLQSNLIKNESNIQKSKKIKFKQKATKTFVDSLPFTLTDSQKKCSWEILQDMEKDKPMARLLEGDVGSGKTVVAAIALLNTVQNKMQSVLMVPTEILANQHFASLKKLFKKSNLDIGLLTRSDRLINNNKNQHNKKEMANIIESGGVDIVIGTHSLIQEGIIFKNLGLAIIDEQHRFGVKQRKELTLKSGNNKTTPHLLSMTATPIPRSLALVLYNDLSISIIDQLPKGRKEIKTSIIPKSKSIEMYEFIRKNIADGRQAFIVCPLIDISDKLGVKSVKEEFKTLDKKIFKDIKIEMLHGKLKSQEKEKIMKRFLQNKTKILISTSVIEVGVDVPNANIMLIEGSDRFGLAQLHQFRGRVGRGEHQSYCFLRTESKSEKTMERLKALVKSNDGFELAKMDLELRGPGEVYGTNQKGFPEFKIATLFDHKLIKETNFAVTNLLNEDPGINNYPLLKDRITDLQKNIHLE